MANITLLINGSERKVEAADDEPLLSVLRNRLGMTGTKYGCGVGQCGACTVLLDGKAVRSCRLTAATVKGKVVTIEGLAAEGNLQPIQQAFLEEEAFQCGYCTSGMVMAAHGLLSAVPKPSDDDIFDHMNGNICRCGTYQRIMAAIHRAAEKGGRA
ncbi:MAG TPA: (2Fe-2S)-binding protein [Candidatus Angelobacter sp.]|jgi:aerobic-type carbon monoxide dehydrogenase small subunit (CoxS/CutS family)